MRQCLKISFVSLSQIADTHLYIPSRQNFHITTLLVPPTSSFLPLHIGAAMARSTLSLFLALASASHVFAQSLSTFPATPLVDMTFAYSNLVCVTRLDSVFKLLNFMLSLSKPFPLHTFAGLKPGTTFAIRPLRTSSPCVKLRSSITSSVRCF